LLDDSFSIFLNGEKITHKHLKDLARKTQFLWKIGELDDPYVSGLEAAFSKDPDEHSIKHVKIPGVSGFIASVEKPRDLKIMTTEERVGIDLFVNGRLRERDILKHIPTARIAESYLYGQIHFNGLDDSKDRFTSSRESIVADDPKYEKFLEKFRKTILKIVDEWDKSRLKRRDEGDPDNERISKKERASRGLYGAVSKEYGLSKGAKGKGKVDGWVDELADDAAFNFESYAECFISENLVRKFIRVKNLPLSPEAKAEADEMKRREVDSKNKGNISIEIRRVKSDLSYLDMKFLSNLVDKRDPAREACLPRDAAEYKPIRDAVAHTSLLTDPAKNKLTTVRENIKGRVKTLLSKPKK
ncbi:MAG: DNA mismatch repair protein, partial [Verrucomicrobiia bacterium]